MINKKAQLGKLISSFPLMILIFIIMGIFIFLASAFSMGKDKQESPNFIYRSIAQDDLMSQIIKINLDTGKLNEVTVLDAFVKYKNGEVKKEAFCTVLVLLLKGISITPRMVFIYSSEKEKPSSDVRNVDCYLIAEAGRTPRDLDVKDVDSVYKMLFGLSDKKVLQRSVLLTLQNGKKIYVDYYMGGAPA